MSLTLSIPRKSSFYLNDVRCEVVSVTGPHDFTIDVHDAPGAIGTTRIKVDSQRMVEVLPNVSVCASNRPVEESREHEAHVVIDAPRSIRILRERLYHREQQKQRGKVETTRGTG